MRPEILKKYAAPVPRYTSYPTAPHFSKRVGPDDYALWLGALPPRSHLSLYVHIPFCDTLCWYCGCNTKVTQRYAPVARYLKALEIETQRVSGMIDPTHEVTHIHFGGGSPSVLKPDDIRHLSACIKKNFNLAGDAEFAVEVDPRDMPEERVTAFAQSGVNRVSIGVQDFNPQVQTAINRVQTYETTARTVELFRAHGVRSINIDLVYGLPHQTRDSVADTIDKVIAIRPDRIALFGYAHLPARLVHQRLIKDETLPDATERFAQANRAASHLVAAGYVQVGLDHFALPHDTLAGQKVSRNFQGYTTDDAAALIGLGASSIGRLPQGYVQNAVPMLEYERCINEGRLATAKGHAFTADDAVRGYAIERLMCDLRFSTPDIERKFGLAAAQVIARARDLTREDTDGLIEAEADDGSFRVTDKGRLFVRTLCAAFDSYLGQSEARHSAGV